MHPCKEIISSSGAIREVQLHLTDLPLRVLGRRLKTSRIEIKNEKEKKKDQKGNNKKSNNENQEEKRKLSEGKLIDIRV